MHALMPVVLLRVTWLDAFDLYAQAQPPHRQAAQAMQSHRTGERYAVVRANAAGQPVLLEQTLKDGEGVLLFGAFQTLAADQETGGEVGDGQGVTVLLVPHHELTLVVGAPQFVGRGGDTQTRIPRMTKSDLITKLASRYPQLLAKDVEVAVKAILGAMTASLTSGERTETRGFGSFNINHRPPRTGRNPRTGGKVAVPEKWVPHVKPGRELKERVDR